MFLLLLLDVTLCEAAASLHFSVNNPTPSFTLNCSFYSNENILFFLYRKSSLVILHHADHSQLPLTSVGVLEIVSTSQKCLQLQLARLGEEHKTLFHFPVL